MKKLLCIALALLTALTAAVSVAAVGDPADAPAEETAAPTEPVEQIPRITDISPVQGGAKISFTPYDGAAKYRVFTKKADGSGWKGIADVAALSYTRTGITAYSSDIYTVRALDAKGKFCSGYDKEGYAYTYLPAPSLKKAESVFEGVKVSWGAVSGAVSYRVYVKTGSSWKGLANVAGTSYTDTNVTSGTGYTYTVRAIDPESGRMLSYFDRAGVSVTYIAAPLITSCTPVQSGVKVSWGAVKGAAQYRLFYKNGSAWKTIGSTSSTSYTHTDPVEGKEYIYTVRATDRYGSYISGYDKNGFASDCFATPVLKKAECTVAGVKVTWKAVAGAGYYRVYLKSGGTWKGIANTASPSFTHKNVVSGVSYTYTVKVIDPVSGKALSYYDRTGVSVTYVAAPVITACAPAEGGTRVTWDKVEGAAKYRLFYKVDGGWKTVGTTTASTLVHQDPAAGQEYCYTVRALDNNGNFVSAYDTVGRTYRYIAPPEIASVEKTQEGVLLSWDTVEGAQGYRVYRKTFGAAFKKLANTDATSFLDDSALADTVYAYTLRTLDGDGQLSSYYHTNTLYYCNGIPADGKIDCGGTTVFFSKGYVRQGYVTIDGKCYYYNAAGTLQKNGIVGTKQEGYRYADKNGVIDMAARLALTWNGSDWNILDGMAYQVTTEKDRTLHRALKLVAKLTTASMTKEQKLRACFNYLQTETYECNPRVPHYRGMDWPIVYANDIFKTGGGNCLSYAAAFGFMAKAIGYTDVYGCHSGGHGWTEIGGLIYDTEWQRSHHTYSYYALSYYTSTDVDYASVKASFPYNAWMHVEI